MNWQAGLFMLMVFALGVFIGWRGEDWLAPTEVVRTDTVFEERTITRRDTVTVTKPVLRRIYQRDTVTVTKTVEIPTYIRAPSVIGPDAIAVTNDDITLTRYDVQSRRIVQDVYGVPRATYMIGPELAGLATTGGVQVAARVAFSARMRYGTLTGFAGYGVGQLRGVQFGLRYRPFNLTF